MKTLFFVMSFMCIVLSRKRRRDDKKISREKEFYQLYRNPVK